MIGYVYYNPDYGEYKIKSRDHGKWVGGERHHATSLYYEGSTYYYEGRIWLRGSVYTDNDDYDVVYNAPCGAYLFADDFVADPADMITYAWLQE